MAHVLSRHPHLFIISILCSFFLLNTESLSPQQLGKFQSLNEIHPNRARRPVTVHNLLDRSTNGNNNFMEYHQAWQLQKELLQKHIDDPNLLSDSLILLEHQPVYTLGTASDPAFIKENTSHIPVVRMDRGGEVTYHGPGQLTIYPVLNLKHYVQDIHWYLRALEESVILTLQELGVENAHRDPLSTGVWVDDHKVAAVGVKAKRWITQHGVAINVEKTSLEPFQGIVPCGLEGRKVGCLQQFVTRDPPLTVQEVAQTYIQVFEQVFHARASN